MGKKIPSDNSRGDAGGLCAVVAIAMLAGVGGLLTLGAYLLPWRG